MAYEDGIITQIDRALRDLDVSNDAMRSTPVVSSVGVCIPVDARQLLIRRLMERHGLSRMTARHAVLAVERGSDSEHAQLVRTEAELVVQEAAERMRATLLPLVRHVARQITLISAAWRPLTEAIASTSGTDEDGN